MVLDLDYIDGQPPLSEEEKDGLLIQTIGTRRELDEFEQNNIEDALLWVMGRRLAAETVFSEKFIRQLHKRMYGNVWAWAGEFRRTDKNLGIDKWQIPVALRALCDDALYWTQNSIYPPDEIAIRFKHGIVSIHCFPNGNGRHSRLMADIIIEKIYRQPVFTWGDANLVPKSDIRQKYLSSLKSADNQHFGSLLHFARS